MLLKKLSIKNFKSFFEETKFSFEEGFNVLLGANSSGKTCVLEAIELAKLTNKPHRSLLNINEVGANWTEQSCVSASLAIEPSELAKILSPAQSVWIGIGENAESVQRFTMANLDEMLTNDGITVSFKHQLGEQQHGHVRLSNRETIWRNFSGNSQFAASRLNLASFNFEQASFVNDGAQDLQALWGVLAKRTYRFSADRKVQRVSAHYADGTLLPSAENLAYCLNWLQSKNPNAFATLNQLVHRIFPTIHWVSAPPLSSNQFEITVHTVPIERDRGDLAIPIDEVGTGIFNAVAILYIALTATSQQIILLEEPNSFLHPRAIRELLAIIAERAKNHQIFITTHSSDVLRTVNASTVTLLDYDGSCTKIRQAAGKRIRELRAGLIDLGIRLTDLYGCDSVLWVEGETEEAVFPLILRKYFPERAEGVAVLRLHSTGDFESRRISASKVADIYRKLSQESFLAPPMTAITLDREGKPKSLIESIEKESNGVVKFLPRPMLEDYLMNPNAVAFVMSKSFGTTVTTAQVEKELVDAVNHEQNLLKPKSKSKELHAANTLDSIFKKLGPPGVRYHKTDHGPKLVDWVLTNSAGDIAELKTWFEQLLKTK